MRGSTALSEFRVGLDEGGLVETDPEPRLTDARRDIVFCDTVSYWYWHWYEAPDSTRILRDKAATGRRVRVIARRSDRPA